ncbi:hypothetical protein AJ80_08203 [Polytolypa hystricis UAMH7299]|uniref:Uncharacterized protein n=1 Tax=Polytolypa hystricis (strain UAMH7299) TaxID=1447883 RepID=A0A2B7X3K5_POLH7|nr:hypothetical protein AJ80_08203 [Polytolypa hystricis UAMH7299]
MDRGLLFFLVASPLLVILRFAYILYRYVFPFHKELRFYRGANRTVFEINQRAIEEFNYYERPLSVTLIDCFLWAFGIMEIALKDDRRRFWLLFPFFTHVLLDIWMWIIWRSWRNECRSIPRAFRCRLCPGNGTVRCLKSTRAAVGPSTALRDQINYNIFEAYKDAVTEKGYIDFERAGALHRPCGRLNGLCNVHWDDLYVRNLGPRNSDRLCILPVVAQPMATAG